MTNKRQYDEFAQRKQLKNAGWRIPKRDAIEFNSGSETLEHVACKMAVCYALRARGFRVATEVVNDSGDSEIDVVAYGKSGKPFAVELETGLTDDVKKDKLDRYVYSNDVIRDCFFLEVENAPTDIHELREWVESQL